MWAQCCPLWAGTELLGLALSLPPRATPFTLSQGVSWARVWFCASESARGSPPLAKARPQSNLVLATGSSLLPRS